MRRDVPIQWNGWEPHNGGLNMVVGVVNPSGIADYFPAGREMSSNNRLLRMA
jgi:hypothetical protein